MNAARSFAAVVLAAMLAVGCSTPRAPQPAPLPPPPAPPPSPPQPVPQPAPPPPPPPERTQEKPSVNAAAAELESVLRYSGTLRNLSGNELRREQEAARQAFTQAPNDLNRVRLALALSLPAGTLKDERRALELLDPMTNTRADYTPLRGFALVVQSFLRDQIKLSGNAQALKEKLDALMSLEKSLAERERAVPGGGR